MRRGRVPPAQGDGDELPQEGAPWLAVPDGARREGADRLLGALCEEDRRLGGSCLEHGVNVRDTTALLCCIGCWKPLPGAAVSDGASMGEHYKCCDRLYESFFAIRSGPDSFQTGWRLIADKDGPVPESG